VNMGMSQGYSKRILRYFEAKPELLEMRRMRYG